MFDIGSASIGACVAAVEQEGVRILWSSRAEYAQAATQTYGEYVGRMKAALQYLSQEVAQTGMRIAARNNTFSANCVFSAAVLSAPWSSSQSSTVALRFPGEKTIDQHTLDMLAQKAHAQNMESDALALWKEQMGGSVSPIELMLTHVCVDGYAYAVSQERPLPRVRGSELFVTAHTAMAPSEPLEAIRAVLRTHSTKGGEKGLYARSSVLLEGVGSRFRKEFLGNASLCAVILGEHMTELVGLRNGAVVAEHVVPYGVYHLLRATQGGAGVENDTPPKTEILWSTVSAYSVDPQHILAQVPEHFSRAVLHWQDMVREGMRAMWKGVAPSGRVLLYADSRIAPYCMAAFEHIDASHIPKRYSAVHVPYTVTQKKQGLQAMQDARIQYLVAQIAHHVQGGV